MEYTQQYEYAKSVVQSFVQAELKLERNQQLDYEQSAMFQLFTFDPAMMTENMAWNKLYKLLFSNQQNNGFAVRLRACAIEIEAALGSEFVDKLRESTKHAIINSAYLRINECKGYVMQEKDRKYYRETETEHVNNVFIMCPWAWIIPIGHVVYRPTLLQLMATATQVSN